jgi:acyl-CoA thioester hydrolase
MTTSPIFALQAIRQDFEPLSTSRMLVRFQDCDPFGHLNNIRYLDYFLNARDNQVTHDYGVSLYDFIQKEKKGWVILKNEIAYLRAVACGSEVAVRTATVYFSDYEAIVEGRMLDKEEQNLHALLWMRLAFFDITTGRRIKHDPDIQAFFEVVRLKEFDAQTTTFDQRVQDLQKYYRAKKRQSQAAHLPKCQDSPKHFEP